MHLKEMNTERIHERDVSMCAWPADLELDTSVRWGSQMGGLGDIPFVAQAAISNSKGRGEQPVLTGAL